MTNGGASTNGDPTAAGVQLRELGIKERDFYTARFENGQQRGLVILTTSAAVVALVGAFRAILPATIELNGFSVLLALLSLIGFATSAVVAIVATGPAWTTSDELPTLPLTEEFIPGKSDSAQFDSEIGKLILTQAEEIRGVANKQARRVMLGTRIEAASVCALAVAVLVAVAQEAGWIQHAWAFFESVARS